MKSARVLVTGGGAPGTRGTLFALSRGAIGEGVTLRLFGADVFPENVPSGLFEKIMGLPSPESAGYLDSLSAIVESNGIDVVLPQTTREIRVLSDAKQGLNFACVVAGKDAIAAANNKARVTKVFSELQLGAPEFRVVHSLEQLEKALFELGFPRLDVVVKITNSSGGRGVRILTNRRPTFEEFSQEKPSGLTIRHEELTEILESIGQFPELLVTEKLEGPEVSVDAYIGRSGSIAIPRTRDAIRTGISTRTTLFLDKSLSLATIRGAQELGLEGVFGFQFMKSASGYGVIECNPRVQGTMVASLMSVNNLVWLAVRDALELEGTVRVIQDWRPMTFKRSWGGSLQILGRDYLI